MPGPASLWLQALADGSRFAVLVPRATGFEGLLRRAAYSANCRRGAPLCLRHRPRCYPVPAGLDPGAVAPSSLRAPSPHPRPTASTRTPTCQRGWELGERAMRGIVSLVCRL